MAPTKGIHKVKTKIKNLCVHSSQSWGARGAKLKNENYHRARYKLKSLKLRQAVKDCLFCAFNDFRFNVIV